MHLQIRNFFSAPILMSIGTFPGSVTPCFRADPAIGLVPVARAPFQVETIHPLFRAPARAFAVAPPEVPAPKALPEENRSELFARLTRQVKLGGRDSKAAFERLCELTEGMRRKLARGFASRYGVDVDDLLQASRVGVMRAAEDFDPGAGRAFPNYARWLVIAEFKKEIGGLGWGEFSAIKARRLMAIRGELRTALGRWPSEQELATAAGFSVDGVVALLLIATSRSRSLEEPAGIDEGLSLHELVASDAPTPEDAMLRSAGVLHAQLDPLLDSLEPRDRQILQLIYGLHEASGYCEHNFREAGEVVGLSHERVRQLHDRALRQLRTIALAAEAVEA